METRSSGRLSSLSILSFYPAELVGCAINQQHWPLFEQSQIGSRFGGVERCKLTLKLRLKLKL